MSERLVTVTRDGWNVAYVSSSLRPGIVELSVFKLIDRTIILPGIHDKKEFPTVEAARLFALEHGYVEIYQPEEIKNTGD